MYWRSPERVFGADLTPLVLKALWGANQPMTGRQVARVAGGSANGVGHVLSRLAAQGLVSQVTVGASYLYEINRDHLMFEAIDGAFRLADPWRRLTARVLAFVGDRELTDHLSIAVYGSVARGDAELDSDIDLLVIVQRIDEQAEQFRSDLAAAVRTWTGQAAGIYLTTPTLLTRAVSEGDPIIESFRADAVTIAGPPVSDYLEDEHP